MSARFTAALVGTAVAALLLGGCRADVRAAPPALPVPVTGAAPAGPADPLADVDAVVGAVERDVDADAGVAGH